MGGAFARTVFAHPGAGARFKVGEIIVAANGAHLVVWTRMRRASARPAEDSGPYLLTRI